MRFRASFRILGRVLVAPIGCPIVLALVGCATGGAERTAPTTPDVATKKPFEAPAWESTKWHSEEHGFSIHYPSDYQEQAENSLFTAASPAMVPRVDVNVGPVAATDAEGLGAAVAEGFKALGGGEATITSSKAVTLQDGVTAATELVLDWSFQGFPLTSVVLLAENGDGMINVTVTGGQGEDTGPLSEIAYTLYLDD